MTGKIITLQQQMSGFSSQIKDLKTEHTQLKEENKKIKKYKNINPSHSLFLDNENNKVDTAEWKIYENKIVGFSLKYPSYINLYSENIFPIPEDESFLIAIKVDSIDVLDGPSGYNKQTVQENKRELEKGNYGNTIDQPFEASKQVVKLGNINAQDFIVFGRFEICDVTFERKLIFYKNNYQVEIILYYPKYEIIANNVEYFKTDDLNCPSIKIWNDEKINKFYENLKSNKLFSSAQIWFNTFDNIVKTIEMK